MELLPLLISFFQFCPNFSFLMTHPLLTSPRLGPFTEMAPAKLTNDFHVATSNGRFYRFSYYTAFDTFNSFVFVL